MAKWWKWVIYYIFFGWARANYTLKILILRINGVPYTGEQDMAVIDDVSEIDLAVQVTNRRGNISQVYGVPVWSTTTAILGLEPAADGLSCVAKALGVLGDGDVKVVGAMDQAETIFSETTIVIPVAASLGNAVEIIEGEIRVQTEFQ